MMSLNTLRATAVSLVVAAAGATAASAETCVLALPFDFGSAAISSTNQGLLDTIRTKYNGQTVDLAGFTDAVGSAAANQALSVRRANTVSRYLSSGTSITVNNVTGFGEGNLKVADSGPNQLNRRVEVTVGDCNPVDFGQRALPVGAGGLGSAGAAAAILGAVLIIGALGDSDSSTTTTTTTLPPS